MYTINLTKLSALTILALYRLNLINISYIIIDYLEIYYNLINIRNTYFNIGKYN